MRCVTGSRPSRTAGPSAAISIVSRHTVEDRGGKKNSVLCITILIEAMSIASRLTEIRERIARAAQRAGRNPDEVALMAVSKNHPASAIVEAINAGQRLFGENRVQEFAGKRDAVLAHSAGGKFHLIGHLQANKAGRAAELFDAIDSVDTLRLAERLNQAAERLDRRLDVLVEINIGGEAAKSGFDPESAELRSLLDAQARLKNLVICGCMTVPPFTEDPEGSRRLLPAASRTARPLESSKWIGAGRAFDGNVS